MSVAASNPTYTIAQNLRWFALVYFAVSAVLSAVSIAALYVWPNFNPPSTALSIGIYLGVAYTAGMRFKQKTNGQWTSRDRNWLAPGYALASFAASLLVISLAMPFDPGTRDAIALVASDGAVAIAIATPIALLVFWAAARLSLMAVARHGGKK